MKRPELAGPIHYRLRDSADSDGVTINIDKWYPMGVTQHTACPRCGCTDLIRYSSLNMKQCPDCKTEIPWEGKPLIGPSRSDRKINIDESVSGEDTGPIENEQRSKIMESYRVRVGYPDGEISVIDVSFSQLVQLTNGGPKRWPLEFYRAEESITNGKGENIKLLTPAV